MQQTAQTQPCKALEAKLKQEQAVRDWNLRHVRAMPPTHNRSRDHVTIRGAPVPDPDPARSNLSGSGSDPDPAGSEVGSGKYWPDLHNYDIKHDSILSFNQMTHDNTELYRPTKTQ